jgi:hypothetical protein
MKALIALAAMALTMFSLMGSASATTTPNAIGHFGVAQPNPRGFGPMQPNPRSWGIGKPNPRGWSYSVSAGQNANRLATSRPLGAIRRW